MKMYESSEGKKGHFREEIHLTEDEVLSKQM